VSAAPWVATYAAALIVWLIVLATGRQPTLWKGRALAWLNAAMIAVLITVMLARHQRPGVGLYIMGALLLASAAVARNAWLLLHVDLTEIDLILKKCFTQTRAPYSKTPAGYSVSAGGGEMSVAITSMVAGYTVRLTGNTDSKKAQLIRSLIAKQFQPSFPSLRIRT
jgi:hypothetical protein